MNKNPHCLLTIHSRLNIIYAEYSSVCLLFSVLGLEPVSPLYDHMQSSVCDMYDWTYLYVAGSHSCSCNKHPHTV
jgi:hypothetical protein